MRYIIALVAVLATGAASANPGPIQYYSVGTVLDDVALNAAAGTRTTSTISTEGWSTLTLGAAFTYSAATAVLIDYCEGTLDYDAGDSSVAWFKIPVIVATSAAGTASYETYKANASDDGTDLAANHKVSFTIGVTGHKNVRCVFNGAGTPDGDDKLTVRATVSAP